MSHRRHRNVIKKKDCGREKGDEGSPWRGSLADQAERMERSGLVPMVISMKDEMGPEVFSMHLFLAILQDSFQCQGCGNCCREEVPVAISEPELELLAKALNKEVQEVKAKYVDPLRLEHGVQYYAIKRVGDSCILLKDNRCLAYSGRPMGCRTFPFYTDTCRRSTSSDTLALPPECPAAGQHVERMRKAILTQDLW